MAKHGRLIARLCMLAVLLAGSWYVMLSPGTKVVYAYQCCETCPGSNPEDEQYCFNQCGSYEGTCYQSCYANMQQCWRSCRSCGGGGGGEDCPGGCPIGYYCAASNSCEPLIQ